MKILVEKAVIEQALEALEDLKHQVDHPNKPSWLDLDEATVAITALREALAEQAEQEPVAWAEIKDGAPTTWMWNPEFVEKNKDAKVVLYATPVRTKDLTDDEILEAVGITDPQGCIKHSEFIGDARAVIAADRKLNKQTKENQE